MWKILGWLLLAALVLAALKLAIIVLILAGLIFRPRETVGLLMIGGILTGFAAHPLIGTGLLVTTLLVGWYIKKKHDRMEAAHVPKMLGGPN